MGFFQRPNVYFLKQTQSPQRISHKGVQFIVLCKKSPFPHSGTRVPSCVVGVRIAEGEDPIVSDGTCPTRTVRGRVRDDPVGGPTRWEGDWDTQNKRGFSEPVPSLYQSLVKKGFEPSTTPISAIFLLLFINVEKGNGVN